MNLVEKVVALHDALDLAAIGHAFGGALALAYCTLDPRGTSDIDCNLFVASSRGRAALEALPAGVEIPAATDAVIVRDGQVRLWWEGTPLDLFFDYHPIHEQAAAGTRLVPFAGTELPVLGCRELVVFKAFFDRTKDWADIEAVAAAGNLDATAVREQLVELLGEDDHRVARLDHLAAGDT